MASCFEEAHQLVDEGNAHGSMMIDGYCTIKGGHNVDQLLVGIGLMSHES